MITTYYKLTKPGIIMGNVITAAGGFALASKGHIDVGLLLITLVGLSLVIACACVFNNYIDRKSDEKMERTKDRALVTGAISGQKGIAFAIVLGLLGSLVLALGTNLLTLAIALSGVLIYVFWYSAWKYHSPHATLVGSIAGGVPPVVGYCAVSHQLDVGALLVFLIVVLWQMPHFFAIATYRLDEYAAASIPVLPIQKGIRTTKIHMLLYLIAFFMATLMPTVFGLTGYTYLAVVASLGLAWLFLCVRGFNTDNHKVWARQMFLFSLIMITALCAVIPFDVTH